MPPAPPPSLNRLRNKIQIRCPVSDHRSAADSARGPIDYWMAPAVIAENNFQYKSLSNWAFNVADLFRTFGSRLLFGMSVPTLRNDLAKVYEPSAPAPTQRLPVLRQARKAGLHIFAAMAPTYPECDEADLRRTLESLWPDKSLGGKAALKRQANRAAFQSWLTKWWSRTSEWPRPGTGWGC